MAPLWYYQVMRHNSLQEAAAAADASPDDPDLQNAFGAMVGRNFGAGLLLGVAIYVALRLLRFALAAAAARPPDL